MQITYKDEQEKNIIGTNILRWKACISLLVPVTCQQITLPYLDWPDTLFGVDPYAAAQSTLFTWAWMSDDLIHGTELRVCVSSQEPSVMTEDDNGSDNSQFTGSTINLQDLEWAAGRWWTSPYTVYTNKTHHLPRTLRAFLDMLGKRGGRELTDKCTLRRRNDWICW